MDIFTRQMNNFTGQRFGRLVAIEPTDKRKNSCVVWRCICDCGNECEVVSARLIRGATRSCGCLRLEKARENAKDISGQRFGRLVAIEPTDKRGGTSVVWRCLCDCGNEYETAAANLKKGSTHSCGCMKKEHAIKIGKDCAKDISGQRFGRLVAIEPTEKRYFSSVVWRCICDCRNEHEAAETTLSKGETKSCGCLLKDVALLKVKKTNAGRLSAGNDRGEER